MAKRIKDDAYLYISTRIKMRRKYLLAAEDFVRMANAPAFAEVKKTLSDKGYLPIEENNADSLEAALSAWALLRAVSSRCMAATVWNISS